MTCQCLSKLDNLRMDHEANPDSVSFVVVALRDIPNDRSGEGMMDVELISHNASPMSMIYMSRELMSHILEFEKSE